MKKTQKNKTISKKNKNNKKTKTVEIETKENKSFLNSIKTRFDKFKGNPKECVKNFFINLKINLANQKLFIVFVIINVLNGILLRALTLKDLSNVFDIKTVLADLSFVLIIGSFSFLFKNKGKFTYLLIQTIIMSALCMINSAYYTFYTSFTSISLLQTAKFITQVGDAVVENVLQPKDLIYAITPFILVFLNRRYKKNGYYEKSGFLERQKKKMLHSFILGLITLGIFSTTLTATDIGRLTKQWNREYVVMRFGIYIYHVNDLVKSIEPKLASLFGYDNALKEFNLYFKDVPEELEKNEYTKKFEGKNIIAIHAESIQNFVIGLKFNGEEVTPNLNKLAKEGMYFNNFYTQVSVGTSSDTEFTLNTSLMPANIGTAFSNYFDREYMSIPKLLKEKGYYSFAMHGNNADYWNRRIMHANLGYDKLIAKADFNIDEVIGLGLSDISFFKQSVEKLKTISSEHNKFYGTFIMLTNHTPFAETDKYGEFDVSIKETKKNEITGELEEVIYPYLEGTKLGNYLKSVHYADKALGVFFEELEQAGLLENTVIVLYGDHDARLPEGNFVKMYNYDKETDGILSEEDPNYIECNEYTYELNRKVPLIIWSKDNIKNAKTYNYAMGMYDLMPTLGNMFGFYNKYALGHDIFSIKDDNIVVFPNGNWLTNTMYYNSQKEESYIINNSIISQDYIIEKTNYANKLLEISDDILVFDLIKNANEDTVNEQDIIEG